MPDPLGPGGWAYWRDRFVTADAERTHLRAEVERLRFDHAALRYEVEIADAEIERLKAALYRARWEGGP